MLRNSSHPDISISYPKYIVFHNYLKLSTIQFNFELINSSSFNSNEIQETMTVEALEALGKKYNSIIKLDHFKEFLLKEHNLINEAFTEVKIDSNKKDIIKKDILENTYFITADNWNITNLIRKYKLSSYDVFLSLLSGYNIKLEDIKKTYDKYELNNGYRYFDYFFGVGFKCRFPDDINNNPFELNMRRYNDRNGYLGYHYIIKLLSDNIDKRSDNFVRFYPVDKKDTQSNNPIIIGSIIKQFISYFKPDANKIINDYVNKTTSYIFENPKFNNKEHLYWSHRQRYDGDICEWNYQMMDFYDKYIKDNITHLSDTFVFDYSDDNMYKQIIYNRTIEMQDLSMVNMLIFGKTNITFEFLERLLSFIRYTENDCIVQLDNYQITKYMYGGYKKKSYNITWKDDNINMLKFCQTDYEKLYAAKNMINLMNEVDPEILNYHNYVIIGQWIMTNDMTIQTQYSSQHMEQSRLDSEKQLNDRLRIKIYEKKMI